MLRLDLLSQSDATTTLDVQKDDGTHLATIRLPAHEGKSFEIGVPAGAAGQASCAVDVVTDTDVAARMELAPS